MSADYHNPAAKELRRRDTWRTFLGRQFIYGWVGLIFGAYGLEAWLSGGTPGRLEGGGVDLFYPAAVWKVLFPAAALLSWRQLGKGRPPHWVEVAWLGVGVFTALARAIQVLEIAVHLDRWGAVLGAMMWVLVATVIIVGMDHRARYRNRA